MSQVEQRVTVELRLEDARALMVFARLGMVWVLRDERITPRTRHGLGRGLYSLAGAIDDSVALADSRTRLAA